MPIRPPPPTALLEDLERARQIARSWKPLDQTLSRHADIVAKAIAEGIAEGRSNGSGRGNRGCPSRRPYAPDAKPALLVPFLIKLLAFSDRSRRVGGTIRCPIQSPNMS